MNKANKAFKFRIYPNSEQETLLSKTFGCVRFIFNKMLSDKIKSYEVAKENLKNTPVQYKSKLYEYVAEIMPVAVKSAIGLDFSMKELYVSSEGDVLEYPHYYRQAQKKLAREQRKLSRRQKNGRNRENQKIKTVKFHERIANQRSDFLHKQSRQISQCLRLCLR